MSIWRKRSNLFYYNIFRFEQFTQHLVAYPIYRVVEIVGLGRFVVRRTGMENWKGHLTGVLNDPKGGISLHLTSMHITLHVAALLLSPWNIASGLLLLDVRSAWFYGGLAFLVIILVASNSIAPSDINKYLNDFKKFESMSRAKKAGSAVVTIMVVIGCWIAFVSSFLFYINALIAAK